MIWKPIDYENHSGFCGERDYALPSSQGGECETHCNQVLPRLSTDLDLISAYSTQCLFWQGNICRCDNFPLMLAVSHHLKIVFSNELNPPNQIVMKREYSQEQSDKFRFMNGKYTPLPIQDMTFVLGWLFISYIYIYICLV